MNHAREEKSELAHWVGRSIATKINTNNNSKAVDFLSELR
jgi:hypothetical protein